MRERGDGRDADTHPRRARKHEYRRPRLISKKVALRASGTTASQIARASSRSGTSPMIGPCTPRGAPSIASTGEPMSGPAEANAVSCDDRTASSQESSSRTAFGSAMPAASAAAITISSLSGSPASKVRLPSSV